MAMKTCCFGTLLDQYLLILSRWIDINEAWVKSDIDCHQALKSYDVMWNYCPLIEVSNCWYRWTKNNTALCLLFCYCLLLPDSLAHPQFFNSIGLRARQPLNFRMSYRNFLLNEISCCLHLSRHRGEDVLVHFQKQADEWVIIHPVNVHTNYQSMNDILNICRLDIDNTDDDKWHEVKS